MCWVPNCADDPRLHREPNLFTGIVEAIGKVESLRSGSGGSRRLSIATDLDVASLPLGASMAVNGVCLTIVARRARRFEADLGPETLACSTLGSLKASDRVHLERPLRLGDMLGGHLVTGHVDGVGKVESARKQGDTLALRLDAPEAVAPFLVKKGSIAIDGVSLTINEVDGRSVEVWLIPHTLSVTLLGGLRAGGRVNMEADMIAKQVARFVEKAHVR
jgi:riboflavin synthase